MVFFDKLKYKLKLLKSRFFPYKQRVSRQSNGLIIKCIDAPIMWRFELSYKDTGFWIYKFQGESQEKEKKWHLSCFSPKYTWFARFLKRFGFWQQWQGVEIAQRTLF